MSKTIEIDWIYSNSDREYDPEIILDKTHSFSFRMKNVSHWAIEYNTIKYQNILERITELFGKEFDPILLLGKIRILAFQIKNLADVDTRLNRDIPRLYKYKTIINPELNQAEVFSPDKNRRIVEL